MDTQRIEAAILDAPAWAQIGITMDHERVRASAAHELALRIADAIQGCVQVDLQIREKNAPRTPSY
ncbi:DUF6771 family protein [Sphingomonas sp. S1-29]|uniref:DUF6771 family protein n=1 Tax=Sphingomonas sp. S1-29 TaxID=2991074 RepID=UPI002AD38DEB|nr:DUF6771 family protein [Sphingomonas sp. S1-29]